MNPFDASFNNYCGTLMKVEKEFVKELRRQYWGRRFSMNGLLGEMKGCVGKNKLPTYMHNLFDHGFLRILNPGSTNCVVYCFTDSFWRPEIKNVIVAGYSPSLRKPRTVNSRAPQEPIITVHISGNDSSVEIPNSFLGDQVVEKVFLTLDGLVEDFKALDHLEASPISIINIETFKNGTIEQKEIGQVQKTEKIEYSFVVDRISKRTNERNEIVKEDKFEITPSSEVSTEEYVVTDSFFDSDAKRANRNRISKTQQYRPEKPKKIGKKRKFIHDEEILPVTLKKLEFKLFDHSENFSIQKLYMKRFVDHFLFCDNELFQLGVNRVENGTLVNLVVFEKILIPLEKEIHPRKILDASADWSQFEDIQAFESGILRYKSNGDEVPEKEENGYLWVYPRGYKHLSTRFLKHLIMADIFLEKIDSNEQLVVDHIDHHRLNNAVENLRYITVSDNNLNQSFSVLGDFEFIEYKQMNNATFRLIRYGHHILSNIYFDSISSSLLYNTKEALRKLHVIQRHGDLTYVWGEKGNKFEIIIRRLVAGFELFSSGLVPK